MNKTLTAKDERLHGLARQYIDQTEAFDQIHCRGRNDRGVAIQVTPTERKLCTENALRLRDELGRKAAEMGFTFEDWRRAISRADLPP